MLIWSFFDNRYIIITGINRRPMQHFFEQNRVVDLSHVREPDDFILDGEAVVVELLAQDLQLFVQQLVAVQDLLALLDVPLAVESCEVLDADPGRLQVAAEGHELDSDLLAAVQQVHRAHPVGHRLLVVELRHEHEYACDVQLDGGRPVEEEQRVRERNRTCHQPCH